MGPCSAKQPPGSPALQFRTPICVWILCSLELCRWDSESLPLDTLPLETGICLLHTHIHVLPCLKPHMHIVRYHWFGMYVHVPHTWRRCVPVAALGRREKSFMTSSCEPLSSSRSASSSTKNFTASVASLPDSMKSITLPDTMTQHRACGSCNNLALLMGFS